MTKLLMFYKLFKDENIVNSVKPTVQVAKTYYTSQFQFFVFSIHSFTFILMLILNLNSRQKYVNYTLTILINQFKLYKQFLEFLNKKYF